MRRKLFTLAAIVSLAVCSATAVLWVRSLWRGDLFAAVGRHALLVRSEPGLIFVDVSRADAGERLGWRHEAWPHPPGWSGWSRLGRRWWDRLGFGHYVGFTASGQRVDQFVVPYYFVVAVAGVLPVLLLVRLARARREAATGRCSRCGYDLRATPERCPECGAVPQVLRRPPHNPPMQRTATASSGAVK